MRVEPYTNDSIVHIIKRGARGMPITRDEDDQQRFLQLLCYLNDQYQDEFWEESVAGVDDFERPGHWPEQQPLVDIMAWTLMPNHFHLVVAAHGEGAIAKFMQRVCGSMTTHFNSKYGEKGSIFQGAYRGRTAELHGDAYARILPVYVMVKNVFELYPGGLKTALSEFDDAYAWAVEYPYSSLSHYAGGKDVPFLTRGFFGELFPSPVAFKNWARECMETKREQLEIIERYE